MEVDDLTHGTVHEYLGHFLAVLGPYYTILRHAPWLNKHHKHKIFITPIADSPRNRKTKLNFRIKMDCTIYSLEHGKHRFMVVVIKKPYAWVLVIFFKGHCIDKLFQSEE